MYFCSSSSALGVALRSVNNSSLAFASCSAESASCAFVGEAQTAVVKAPKIATVERNDRVPNVHIQWFMLNNCVLHLDVQMENILASVQVLILGTRKPPDRASGGLPFVKQPNSRRSAYFFGITCSRGVYLRLVAFATASSVTFPLSMLMPVQMVLLVRAAFT